MKHPETSVHGAEKHYPSITQPAVTQIQEVLLCVHQHYTKLIFLFLKLLYLLTAITDVFLSLQLHTNKTNISKSQVSINHSHSMFLHFTQMASQETLTGPVQCDLNTNIQIIHGKPESAIQVT